MCHLEPGVARSKLLLISNKHVLRGGTRGDNHQNSIGRRDDGTPEYGRAMKTFTDSGILWAAILNTQNENVDLACVDVSQFTHTDAYIVEVFA